MKARRKAVRPQREHDLLELRTYRKRAERRVADALVTLLRRADPHVMGALGVVVEFVALRATRRSR